MHGLDTDIKSRYKQCLDGKRLDLYGFERKVYTAIKTRAPRGSTDWEKMMKEIAHDC